MALAPVQCVICSKRNHIIQYISSKNIWRHMWKYISDAIKNLNRLKSFFSKFGRCLPLLYTAGYQPIKPMENCQKKKLSIFHIVDEIYFSSKLIKKPLNPNWHEGWYFYLLVLFGSYFVSFIKNFQTLTSIELIWHHAKLSLIIKSSRWH